MNIIVLISGNGSNLKAIIEHINNKKLPIKILAVISNNSHAYGLKIAEQYNIKSLFIPDTKNSDKLNKTEYSKTLLEIVQPLNPDYIILAGFMRILSTEFINYFPNKIINIHPSLLPKYPGLNTHQKALANSDKEHGCTIHIVTEQLDAGPILAQSACMISAEDDTESLKNKVQKLEHKLYPQIIEKLLHKYSN